MRAKYNVIARFDETEESWALFFVESRLISRRIDPGEDII